MKYTVVFLVFYCAFFYLHKFFLPNAALLVK